MSLDTENLTNGENVKQEEVVDSQDTESLSNESDSAVDSSDNIPSDDEVDIEESTLPKTREEFDNVAGTIRKKTEEKTRKKTRDELYDEIYDEVYEQVNNNLNVKADPIDSNSENSEQHAGGNPSQALMDESTHNQARIASLGRKEYPDWEEKVSEILVRADSEIRCKQDPTLASIITEITNLPKYDDKISYTKVRDLIYKVASDSSTINEIRRLNPMLWRSELSKMTQSPKSEPKIANEPVKELKAPPISDGGGDSLSELKKAAHKRFYGG